MISRWRELGTPTSLIFLCDFAPGSKSWLYSYFHCCACPLSVRQLVLAYWQEDSAGSRAVDSLFGLGCLEEKRSWLCQTCCALVHLSFARSPLFLCPEFESFIPFHFFFLVSFVGPLSAICFFWDPWAFCQMMTVSANEFLSLLYALALEFWFRLHLFTRICCAR